MSNQRNNDSTLKLLLTYRINYCIVLRMSFTTIICLNPLCGYIGFKSLDVCPTCGGPVHAMFDEEPEAEYEIAPRYVSKSE